MSMSFLIIKPLATIRRYYTSGLLVILRLEPKKYLVDGLTG